MTTKETATAHHRTATVHKKEASDAESPVSTSISAAKPALPAAIVAPPPPIAIALTDAQIQQLTTEIDAIAAILGTLAPPLTIEERRQQPKMKTGGDKQIPDVLNLADQYRVSIPGGGTAEARADVQLVATLQPILSRLTALVSLVEDAILQANGRAWETTTTLYAMLIRLVKRFPALQGELQPMASFMARIHKSAPTNLRRAEASSLAKGRATRKATKAKTAAGTQPVAVSSSPVAPAPANGNAAASPASAPAVAPPARSS
jgi:hypothetical protein